MSHHYHHDEDNEMIDTNNENNNNNNTIVRRHSHTHTHLNPIMVFDHIKTKVKRKHSSNNHLGEIHNNSNGHIIFKRSSQEHNELEGKITPIEIRSQPIILQQITSDQRSDDSRENKKNETNHLSMEKEKHHTVVVSDHTNDDDDDIDDPVQWRLSPIEHHIDNKSKSKTKSSKTHLESNGKTRRQKTRHTAFQIRDEDFNSIFKELPSDEKLIVGYPCAWEKDIFMHGRMFLTVNYLCFYATFFKWEESLCIAYKDIISVKREKSTEMLPNAIRLRTKNRDQYLFASYIPRERIFIAISRLWKNALLDKPLEYEQLKTIVYADRINIDESTGDSEESLSLDSNDKHSPKNSPSLPAIVTDRSKELLNVFIDRNGKKQSSVPTDLSKEPTIYPTSCSCETHSGRTYAERVLPYHVNQLFELIFGDNSFSRAFHDSQKLTDYTIGEWRRNAETGKRERQVTYKTVTQSMLGTNTISCTDKQTIEVDKPHSMYVVNTEVYNEGMKYTDAFFVATRFCMFQCDAKNCLLRITAEIKYIKNVNSIAKAFIEKNCHSNIEDGVNNQIRRLENRQKITGNQKSDINQRSSPKQRVQKGIDDSTNSVIEKSGDSTLSNVISSSDNQSSIREKSFTGKGFFFDMGLFLISFLLLLHIYLCYKLYSIDQTLNNPDSVCLVQCTKSMLSNKFGH